MVSINQARTASGACWKYWMQASKFTAECSAKMCRITDFQRHPPDGLNEKAQAMKRIPPFLKLVVPILLILLSSCEAGKKPANGGVFREAEREPEQHQISLDSLSVAPNPSHNESGNAPKGIDTSDVVVEEGIGFGGIRIDDPACNKEFIKSELGAPDEESEQRLNYRTKYGIDFWMANPAGPIREIRLNQGFKGRLASNISMASSMADVFDAYGKPVAEKTVDNLAAQRHDTMLFRKDNHSRINYARHGLLFWFEEDRIYQIVVFRRSEEESSSFTLAKEHVSHIRDPEAARRELERLNIEYDPESFVNQAARGNTGAVYLFLTAGMNPNVRGKHGPRPRPALPIAANKGHIDTVKLLLESGADVNIKSQSGDTALILATDKGYIEIIRILLEHGANPNARGNYDRTALMKAGYRGWTDIARLLLENGADVDARCEAGTALADAANHGHIDIVRLLLDKGADINARDNNGCTPLMKASEDGHIEVVAELLDRGAHVNVRTRGGVTALTSTKWRHGPRRDRTEIIRLLEEAGAVE